MLVRTSRMPRRCACTNDRKRGDKMSKLLNSIVTPAEDLGAQLVRIHNEGCIANADTMLRGYEHMYHRFNDKIEEGDVVDVLTDIIHWCKANAIDFELMLQWARNHQQVEEDSAHV
jgi:hypothetical protein